MLSTALNDSALWALIQQGDRVAFEQLYRRHMRTLYSAIYKWVGNQADAEDILQEVFIDLWEKRNTITIQQALFPYLYSMVRFKVFDHVRSSQLSQEQLAAWSRLKEAETAPVEHSPAQMSVWDETVAELAPRMRQVYNLRYRDEKSIPEIAATLLVSPSTVKNQLQQIRKRLQSAVARVGSLVLSFFLLLMRL